MSKNLVYENMLTIVVTYKALKDSIAVKQSIQIKTTRYFAELK